MLVLLPFILFSAVFGWAIAYFVFAPDNLLALIGTSVGFAFLMLLIIVFCFFISLWIIGAGGNPNQKVPSYHNSTRKKLSGCMDFVLALFGVKIHAEGFENVPNDEPFLVIANHRSNIDPIILDKLLRKYKLAFICKHTLFRTPWIGKIIAKAGYLKLDRMDIGSGFEIVRHGQSYLDVGVSIGVFPEGTRGSDEHDIAPFKSGCFLIATKMRKPIVVTVLHNAHGINKWKFFKRHDVYAKVIKVYRYEDYKDMNVNALSDEIHALMLEEVKKDK
ncbi:MAG: 1-acyl-sn-glycerol-3-phosphate acyltransferase [Bacilli bacterium]|nr:1-acyl-sn-glycerol-3-phosphate acyltransferase [Bacilli bacterium]